MSRMSPKQIRAAQARYAKLNPPLRVHEHIADPELESFDRFDRMDYYNQEKSNNSNEFFDYEKPESVYDGFVDTIGFVG